MTFVASVSILFSSFISPNPAEVENRNASLVVLCSLWLRDKNGDRLILCGLESVFG